MNKYRIYHVYEEFIAFILRVGVVYPAYITGGQLLLAVCRCHGYTKLPFSSILLCEQKTYVNEHENMHEKHKNKIVV